MHRTRNDPRAGLLRTLLRRTAVGAALTGAAGTALVLVVYGLNPTLLSLPWRVCQDQSLAALVYMARGGLYVEPVIRELRFDPELGRTTFGAATERCRAPRADPFDCGIIAWHDGRFDDAVTAFEQHRATAGDSEQGLLWLGLATMRRAEQHNCLDAMLGEHAGHQGHDSHQGMCALPLTIFHRDRADTLRAAEAFETLARVYGPDPHYRWLANFTHMPADGFPHDVSPDVVLSPDTPFFDAFYGKHAQRVRQISDLVLVDRAAELEVDYARSAGGPDSGKGVAVEDFNADGCLDIVTGGFHDRMSYFQSVCDQPGTLAFDDRSVPSGLSAVQGTHILTAADYDDDGDIDLFVSRPFGSPRGDAVLLQNNGHAVFTDVTADVGLDMTSDGRYQFAWGSAWGDIDADGDLDLFVANYHFGSPFHKDSRLHMLTSLRDNVPSALYRNDGGRFVDITEASGVGAFTTGHNLHGAAFGDYDQDGQVDLAITRMFLPGVVILHNEGEGRFAEAPLADRSTSMGFMAAFVDVDHDGQLDLFNSAYGTSLGTLSQAVFQGDQGNFANGSKIWKQGLDGWTVDEQYFGTDVPLTVMGVNFGDLDHDGHLDWYLGTGGAEPWYVVPNLMYRGNATDGLDDISAFGGVATVQKGHGIIYADFDRDGDQDIYSSLGGAWPGDAWPNQLFVNDSPPGGRWVRIALHGCASNRFGLNSLIVVHASHANGSVGMRTYHMDNKTGFGSAPYLADIGLGDAVGVATVEVRWSGPGARRIRYELDLDAEVVLVESGDIVSDRAAAEAACANQPAPGPPE
ncbi:MAG: VCBS repeat-containing protein [Myxococcales bacterium]|nr:VCBS repeat-containing protein [Myxococcales bacterium]